MTALLPAAEAPEFNFGSRFALSEEEIRSRTAEFLQGLKAMPGQLVGAVVTPDSPMFIAVCSTERQVFEQAFAGNDAAYMEAKYGPLTDSSRFLVTVERDEGEPSQGRPIAFMRLVTPAESDNSTMSIDDAAANIGLTHAEIRAVHHIDDLGRCWDVATMGVLQEYHNTFASIEARLILNRMFVRLAAREAVQHMLAIIDQKALDSLLLVGTPIVPMGDPTGTFDDRHAFEFDSSQKSYAVYGYVPGFLNGVAARYNLLATDSAGPGRDFLREVVGRILTGNEVDNHIALTPEVSHMV